MLQKLTDKAFVNQGADLLESLESPDGFGCVNSTHCRVLTLQGHSMTSWQSGALEPLRPVLCHLQTLGSWKSYSLSEPLMKVGILIPTLHSWHSDERQHSEGVGITWLFEDPINRSLIWHHPQGYYLHRWASSHGPGRGIRMEDPNNLSKHGFSSESYQQGLLKATKCFSPMNLPSWRFPGS